jgi:hypothetical protein
MKDTITKPSTFNPWEEKKTFRPPLPTELTVIPSVDEPQSNYHVEEDIKNTEESDESTGQVENKHSRQKIVNPVCNIDSDHKRTSNTVSYRSFENNVLNPKSNPLSINKSTKTSNSNNKESNTSKISREALISDKSIIVGKKVKVPFPGIGNYVCKIEKYTQDADTHTLSHPDDNWSGDMTFNDVVKLILKSWLAEEHIAHVNAISCAYLETLDTDSCISVSSVLIAHFTESANFTKSMMDPDCKEWKDT